MRDTPISRSDVAPAHTRRDVLRNLGGLGLLTLTGGAGTLLGARAVQSGADVLAADPEIAALVDSTIAVDMHSHAAGASARPKPTSDLAQRLRTGRTTAVCLDHSADSPVPPRAEAGDVEAAHRDEARTLVRRGGGEGEQDTADPVPHRRGPGAARRIFPTHLARA